MLQEAIKFAQQREPIIPRGSSSISRLAALLTDNRTTFVGVNSYKTHPIVRLFSQDENKICLHAELDAIRQAVIYFQKIAGRRRDDLDFDLSEFSMYVARVLHDGTPALAYPCPACREAIKYFKIKDVYWTGV